MVDLGRWWLNADMDSSQFPANATPGEYAEWFNARICNAVLHCRLKSGLSPRALGRINGIHAQTYRNTERCIQSPKLVTLALICYHLDHRTEQVVQDAFPELQTE